MKVLQINKFWYPHGGADIHAIELSKLLSERGYEIGYFGMRHPKNIDTLFAKYFINQRHITRNDFEKRGETGKKFNEAVSIIYSRSAAKSLDILLNKWKPDVAHIHNIYHHLSPSVLVTLKRHKIPVIQTLHDYKRMCPNHAMYTHGKICEQCKGGKYWNAIKNKCIFNSRSASAVVATEMLIQRLFGWYDNYVDYFIATSVFLKNKLREWGESTKNVAVIPNFVSIPDYPLQYGTHVLYVGRISSEKGVDMLIDAAKMLPKVIFDIVGDGPEREELEQRAKKLNNVVFYGFKTKHEIDKIAENAACVVLAARWYENYPLSLLEMAAAGKALVGARVGGIPEIIEDGVTGVLFRLNDIKDLVLKLRWILEGSRTQILGMAGRERVMKYNDISVILPQIENVYEKVMSQNTN